MSYRQEADLAVSELYHSIESTWTRLRPVLRLVHAACCAVLNYVRDVDERLTELEEKGGR